MIIGSKIYDFNPRSPYGERPRRCCPLAVRWYFNPRSPYGERRGLGKLGWKVSCISIHAPLTGSDCSRHFCWRTLEWISIHAPLTGSDLPAFVGGRNIFYFNPRSPYGERQGVNIMYQNDPIFQSTLPLRGATLHPTKRLSSAPQFQSTLPLRGATVKV